MEVSTNLKNIKAVILAGGLGTRLSEETDLKPKPMVQIGGKPILWHILKIYSQFGINQFIICCGYKGYIIKEYFANYFLHMSDVTIDLGSNNVELHTAYSEPWKITLLDTGESTMTAGRLAKAKPFLDDTFCFTYGDGVGNINIEDLISDHRKSGKKATITVVQPPGRYGAISLDGNKVTSFREKPKDDSRLVSGGFFVLEPSVLEYIDGDSCSWEEGPINKLVETNNLNAYIHKGFWRPMDTLRDKRELESMWLSKQAPWKIWND